MQAYLSWRREKKAIYSLSISLIFLSFLASCAYPSPINSITPLSTSNLITPTEQPEPTPSPSIAASAIPTHNQSSATATVQLATSAATPVPPQTYHAPAQYNLDAVLDYYEHSLSVTERIRYTNPNTDTITGLTLVVEPSRWPGCFTLTSLAWEDGEAVKTYDLQDAQLQISLLQPLQSGDSLVVKLVYKLEFPQIPAPTGVTRPVPFGYSDRQTNIVDWYPYIPPYQPGKGWLVHPKWGFGEHQVFEMADFDVSLSLTDPVKNLVIAASSMASENEEGYTYHLENARSFAMSASDEYLVQSTRVGDVTIYSYSFPFDKSAGEQVLNDAAKSLELYSNLFTPYPHSSLSAVEADFLDGMEYDGLVFLSRGFYNLYDGTPQGYLTFITAHETAHQWWYGLVGNDQALEPWLDEAICTYMEHVFYENVYPDYKTSSGESLVNWWWYYRVNFYAPGGWVDGQIYDFNLFRPYRDAVYLNGAKFLQDLRTLVGDPVFFAFLKDYAVQKTDGIATATDFFTILRSHTSKNLDSLMRKYFHYSK